MKILLTFERIYSENPVEELTNENEKVFLTIENLGGKVTNVNIEQMKEEEEFTFDEVSYETIVHEFSNVTFEIEVSNEKVSGVTTFLDLLLEMDYQFTYEMK